MSYIKPSTDTRYVDDHFREDESESVFILQVVMTDKGFAVEGGFRLTFIEHAKKCSKCAKVCDCLESAISEIVTEARAQFGLIKKQ